MVGRHAVLPSRAPPNTKAVFTAALDRSERFTGSLLVREAGDGTSHGQQIEMDELSSSIGFGYAKRPQFKKRF